MRKHYSWLILCMVVMLAGCASPPTITPKKTQFRPIEALPTEVASDTMTVLQFRKVCDQMARNMIIQPFVSQSPRPPVVTIRKLENKTGIEIDESIFQETIRVKLMEYAGGRVFFRDDASYKDILKERMQQSSNEVNMTLTDTTVMTRENERFAERKFEGGSLSGMSKGGGKEQNIREEQEVTISQTGKVKAKVAGADYFLRGIIYQLKEEDVNRRGQGMNYFQYQFRVVDARTGLIAWEKMLSSKMEGKYTLPEEDKQGTDQSDAGAYQTGYGTGFRQGVQDAQQGLVYILQERLQQQQPAPSQQHLQGYQHGYEQGYQQGKQGQSGQPLNQQPVNQPLQQ
ncbi:hypothetical protein QUF90_21830 [Desulfococcaceae bacterium HSG9]|nr:hypothetical protein [Desulfococcaceae bacterium HSG9]